MSHSENELKFILFYLGGELFGTPLLSVKEVIKVGKIKPVPYLPKFFSGVINLRGQVLSIVDLKTFFGIKTTSNEPGLILIMDTPSGPVGAIIDGLESVTEFQPGDIDQNPNIKSKVSTPHFRGVAKLNDKLIGLIDVCACLSQEIQPESIRKGA